MSKKTWTANCFMGSDVGWQEVTVQSNTVYGARRMIERIYEPEFIQDLCEEDGGGGSSFGCLSVFFWPLVLGFVVSFLGGPFIYGLIGGVVLLFMGR